MGDDYGTPDPPDAGVPDAGPSDAGPSDAGLSSGKLFSSASDAGTAQNSSKAPTSTPASKVGSKQPTPMAPLNKDDLRFLAMEGGGGKGFAYLGAVQALEKLDVMKKITAYAGASAGAIMSMLLSIGYDAQRLQDFMTSTDFDAFFDDPKDRHFPKLLPAPYEARAESQGETEFQLGLRQMDGAMARSIIGSVASGAAKELGLAGALSNLQKAIAKATGNGPPVSVLAENLEYILAYMPRDMGVFSGQHARDVFAGVLNGEAQKLGWSGEALTFADHFKYFRKTLLVTGTNLSNGTTQMFSWRDTPDFPVADAIRISMSLPFIYKPYVITEADGFNNAPHCGTYVDGGVWNNLPFREFDDEPRFGGDAGAPGAPPTRTLGLRLEITEAKEITNFWKFLLVYGSYGMTGSGESQVTERFKNRMVLLDTTGLSLINFTPKPEIASAAIARARAETLAHFGDNSELAALPDIDLQNTRKLTEASDLCHPAGASDAQLFPWIKGMSSDSFGDFNGGSGGAAAGRPVADGDNGLHGGQLFGAAA